MKRRWMLLALLLAGSAHAQDAAQKVVECMRANVPPHLAIRSLELVAHDRTGGTRTMKGRLFMSKTRTAEMGKDLISAALYIDLPTELKGAAYLVKETDDYLRDGMFVYLPAVKRVRRITGTFADGSMMGTNFSYFDFKQLQNAFSDLTARHDGYADVHGRRAHVLSYTVLEGTETRYTGGKMWVDEEACVVVKGEFYEQNRRVAKSFSSPAGALKKSDGAWYLAEVEMQEPGVGTKTIARISKLDTKSEVPNRYFDPNLFYLGP